MVRSILFAALVLFCMSWSFPVSAQYLFADTDGNGVWTSADRLQKDGATKVDIWLQTNEGRGGPRAARAVTSRPAALFSYQFVLQAAGGTVQWGEYVNAQASMDMSFGRRENATELSVGFAGRDALPAGRYKLGTLTVRIASGTPELKFRSRGSILPLGETAFGSLEPGRDDDHSLKLAAEDGSSLGDWTDADGVGNPIAPSRAAGTSQSAAPRFAVRITPNPSRSSDLHLSVTTTKSGVVRARLFDLQGKLVRTLVSDEWVGAGVRSFNLSGGTNRAMASGIYLYRIEAPDGVASGRLTILH